MLNRVYKIVYRPLAFGIICMAMFETSANMEAQYCNDYTMQ